MITEHTTVWHACPWTGFPLFMSPLFNLSCNWVNFFVCVLQDQARAQAELLRRQEELERKAAELDRREREMQSLNASGGVNCVDLLVLWSCIICEAFIFLNKLKILVVPFFIVCLLIIVNWYCLSFFSSWLLTVREKTRSWNYNWSLTDNCFPLCFSLLLLTLLSGRKNNWPPLPEKFPVGPCFYHDISVDIPVEFQKTVKIMYYLWMCECLASSHNPLIWSSFFLSSSQQCCSCSCSFENSTFFFCFVWWPRKTIHMMKLSSISFSTRYVDLCWIEL